MQRQAAYRFFLSIAVLAPAPYVLECQNEPRLATAHLMYFRPCLLKVAPLRGCEAVAILIAFKLTRRELRKFLRGASILLKQLLP